MFHIKQVSVPTPAVTSTTQVQLRKAIHHVICIKNYTKEHVHLPM